MPSYIDTISERSEPSELDLSMLPLDAKTWEQRVQKRESQELRNPHAVGYPMAKNLATLSQSIPTKTKHNYENHDIKTVRIAPRVTQFQYSGKLIIFVITLITN